MRKLIYEDEELNVIYKSGASDFLLIIFGDLAHLIQNEKFYAEPVISKLNFNTICFTARTPNWFPEYNVKSGLQVCVENGLLLGYRKILIFGASMGGYAAIKYASLFNAQYVLAYCPQYSLDPEECDNHVNGYEEFYSNKMKGMGIKKNNILGNIKNIYIVYDPQHVIDNFHVSKILLEISDICTIRFHSGNHDIPKILAGTKIFESIVVSILNNNREDLYRIISYRRRSHPLRKYILMNKLIERHPNLAIQVFEKNYIDFSKNNFFEADLNGMFINFFNYYYNLNNKIVVERLLKIIKSKKVIEYKKSDSQEVISLWNNRPDSIVSTFHNSLVCVDILFMQLANYTSEIICINSFRYIPVFIKYYFDEYYLVVFFNQNYYICLLEDDNKTINLLILNDLSKTIDKGYSINLNQQEKYFNLKSNYNELNCCAEPTGNVAWNRPFVYGWETFFIK